MLLDRGINAFVAISAVADLDGVAMIAQMNARTFSGVIAVDVEFWRGMTQCTWEVFYRSCTLEWSPKSKDHQREMAPL